MLSLGAIIARNNVTKAKRRETAKHIQRQQKENKKK